MDRRPKTRAPVAPRRGALGNPAGRFDRWRLEPTAGPEAGGEACSGATTVTSEITRTIITRNDSPDIPFDRSINPYRGCEHGCTYCFARASHSWLGLSPGLDFETRIVSKPDAARILAQELRRPGYRCAPVAMGSNTDPYQPVERHLRITRDLLEVLLRHRHPVTLVTKSSLVLRDTDLLAALARQRLVSIMISVTSLDPTLAGRMEPRAASPRRRLETLRALADAGIPAGVLVSPIIPGLNDEEIERIVAASAAAGARAAACLMLRLPFEVKDVFTEWIRAAYPSKAPRVLGLIRSVRGGRLDDHAFGSRMRGSGPLADLVRRRFAIARRRCALSDELPALDTSLFRVPGSGTQGSLFS